MKNFFWHVPFRKHVFSIEITLLNSVGGVINEGLGVAWVHNILA